jgi:hypothetical protein
MATVTGKARCVICKKERSAVRCEGCLQIFCFNHLNDHRQDFNRELDEIEMNRDLFRQTLNEQINHPPKHILIKQIDQWELDSIEKIQQTAKTCRETVCQQTNKHFNQMEMNLNNLTNQIRNFRQENDFNEIDLKHLKQKLTQLEKDLDQISANVSIQEDSRSFINKISVVISSGKWVYSIWVAEIIN